MTRRLVTARTLAEAQHAANEVDHEDHDEAVVVALEVAAPLIAQKALEDFAAYFEKTGRSIGIDPLVLQHVPNIARAYSKTLK